MGKVRDLFKKLRDTEGTFHAKMGTIKDRNGMDLTEAEDIKKRWQNTQKNCTKKIFNPDNHDGVSIHLEPDILECEVKWALRSITTIKASGGDGIPVELFQSLKDDAVKVLYSMFQPIWKPQQCHMELQNVSLHSNPREWQCKECSNYCIIELISHASTFMLKILQTRLQQCVN